MHEYLSEFVSNIEFTDDLQKDVFSLLLVNGQERLIDHVVKVANEARKIARHYDICDEKAYLAGLLHDIGRIIPPSKSIDICKALGIQLFEEEKLVPSILHGKLSKAIISDIFNVDIEICNAVECHSTLKANPSKLDLVLFIADKISWDREDNKVFIQGMLEGLNTSLECSAIIFLEYLNNGHAEILHPWAIEAYNYLRSKCK